MTIQIFSLDDLNKEDVDAGADVLEQFIQDAYPDLDIRKGVLRDIVLELWGIFYSKTRTEINRYLTASSMLAVQEDPTLAEDGVVDRIMSNYNVTRYAGNYSSGLIMLEFLKDNSVIIPSNAEFMSNGITYRVTQDYTYSPSTSDLAVVNYKLTPLSNGNYGATASIRATSTGSAGNIVKNTAFTPITNFADIVKVYATQDFTGGGDTESNTALLSRLAAGMATPTWGNRDQIDKLLRNDENLPDLVAVSVVGCGDPELLRDQHQLFPISTGGKADVYVKTSPGITSVTVQLAASLQSASGMTATWRLEVPRTVLSGAYAVSQILPVNSGQALGTYNILSQEVVSNRRHLTAEEAFYSDYQSFLVTFETDDEAYTYSYLNPVFKYFDVTLTGLPNIKEATNRIERRDLIPICCDALVRAAIPCFIYIDLTIKQSSSEYDSQQEQDIKNAIIAAVNNTGFEGSLSTSLIVPVVQEWLNSTQSVYRLHISATVLGPNNNIYRQSDCQVITVPTDTQNHVSPNTVTFFTDFDSIDINYIT